MTANFASLHSGSLATAAQSNIAICVQSAGFRYHIADSTPPAQANTSAHASSPATASTATPTTSCNAIADITLNIRDGEFVVLCGQSGCGKTTVTRLCNGLIPVFYTGDLTGACTVYGLAAGQEPIEQYAAIVGSVFQNPKTQYFNALVVDELAFPCENAGWEPAKIRERVTEVAQRFGISHLVDRSIFQLSGGEKQRIAVASACMLRPKLLVLDEPTSNLDYAAMNDLTAMLEMISADGVTIVVAEHRLAWCANIADRYVLIESGRIVGDYSAADFAALPESVRENAGLRTLNIAPYRRRVANMANCWPNAMSHEHRQGEKSETPRHSQQQPVLSTRGLVVGYRQHKRLADRLQRKQSPYVFSLSIPDCDLYSGEIVGLMGHNGSGKSTLVRTLTGLAKPLDGTIFYRGTPAHPRSLIRCGFLVMQDVNYQLFADSVRGELLIGAGDTVTILAEHVAVGQAEHLINAHNGKSGNGTCSPGTKDGSSQQSRKPSELYAHNSVFYDEEALGVLADCDHILNELDLNDVADRHPMSLSGGQKQRTAIASALMCGKEIIVLDEPTSGLDRQHMLSVGMLLRRLADKGKTVLVVTHDEELAAQWCDRILDLDHIPQTTAKAQS